MARKITRASLAEFAKEIAALEAAEARILSPREQEGYVGGRDSAYSSFGTAVDDHQAHALAGLDHDLLSTEVGSFDPHTRSAIGICSFSPSGAVTDDGSGFFEDGSGYITGSGGDIELPEVVIRDKGKKKKKKPTPSDPPSFEGGGGYWGGESSPSQPKQDEDQDKQSHQDTNPAKPQPRPTGEFDKYFCIGFPEGARLQVEKILKTSGTIRHLLQLDSGKYHIQFAIGAPGQNYVMRCDWTNKTRTFTIKIHPKFIHDGSFNHSMQGTANNGCFNFPGGIPETLAGNLVHEAIHVSHLRAVQEAFDACHQDVEKAYYYLQDCGYSVEFRDIFFINNGYCDALKKYSISERTGRKILDLEHDYMCKYEQGVMRQAVIESLCLPDQE